MHWYELYMKKMGKFVELRGSIVKFMKVRKKSCNIGENFMFFFTSLLTSIPNIVNIVLTCQVDFSRKTRSLQILQRRQEMFDTNAQRSHWHE